MAVGTGSSPHAWRPDSLHLEALGCGPVSVLFSRSRVSRQGAPRAAPNLLTTDPSSLRTSSSTKLGAWTLSWLPVYLRA